MTTRGTCYFPTRKSAIAYYYDSLKIKTPDFRKNVVGGSMEIVNQNILTARECVESVDEKIADKSIIIGRPALKSGETLFIKGGRYHIESKN